MYPIPLLAVRSWGLFEFVSLQHEAKIEYKPIVVCIDVTLNFCSS